MSDELFDHPDLSSAEWDARAAKLEREYARRTPRAPRNRKLRSGLPVILVIVAVLGGWACFSHPWRGAVPVQTAASATVTATSRAPSYYRVNLNMPFLETAAADWPDGAAGFQPPPAAPVGNYDADTVATAYQKVRQLLILQRIDRAAITTNDTARVLGQFAPTFRDHAVQQLQSEPDKATGYYVTAIAPGQLLLPAQPKVTGNMSAAVDKDGNLSIHTSYITAYAFDPGDATRVHDAMDIIVVQRWDVDYTVIGDQVAADGGHYATADQGIWMDNGAGHSYGGECGWARKGFLAASLGNGHGLGLPETRDPDYYFDPGHPLPTTDGCR